MNPPEGLIVEIDRFDTFMRVWRLTIDPLILRDALITIRTYFCQDYEVRFNQTILHKNLESNFVYPFGSLRFNDNVN